MALLGGLRAPLLGLKACSFRRLSFSVLNPLPGQTEQLLNMSARSKSQLHRGLATQGDDGDVTESSDGVTEKVGFLRSAWRRLRGSEADDGEDAAAAAGELEELKWGELVGTPSVDNALALVLSGLLILAVLKITWQLLLVAAAIIISGLKYTVLAAFLVALIIFFL